MREDIVNRANGRYNGVARMASKREITRRAARAERTVSGQMLRGFQPMRPTRKHSDRWFTRIDSGESDSRRIVADDTLLGAYDAQISIQNEELHATTDNGLPIIERGAYPVAFDETLDRLCDVVEKTLGACEKRNIDRADRMQDIALVCADGQAIGPAGRALLVAGIGRAVRNERMRQNVREAHIVRQAIRDDEKTASA